MTKNNKLKQKASKLSIFAITLAFIALSSISLSACGENSTQNSDGGGEKTLYILSSAKKSGLDPAKSQGLNITTLSLITRRLLSWNVPKDGSEVTISPDLATAKGEVSDDGKKWTYHLKSGIRFENGEEITAQDIKWGVERSFADELTGGLSLHKNLLVGGSDYHGPFSGEELNSIETPDEKTISFKLERPFASWDWIVSTPAFSPVPRGTVATTDYDEHPASSGAYKVKEYETGVKLVLDKNPNWDASTDQFRLGDADKIVIQLGQSAEVATDRLIADQGDDRFAFASSFVAPQKLVEINSNEQAKNRLHASLDGAIKYLALNTSRAPLNNLQLRIALEYAVDKNALRLASGGEIAGDFATTLITPGISEREEFDLFPADPSGDIEKAKQILSDARIDPTSITLKFPIGDSAREALEAQAVTQGIEKLGIKVDIRQMDSDSLFDFQTSGLDADYDLALRSWQPDIPTADSNIEPLYSSTQIGNGNFNLSHYSNSEVDKLIEKAQEELNPEKAKKLWQELDRKILSDAPVVPLIYTKNSWLIGSNVDNFYIGSFPAYPNYLQITVK